MALAVLAGCAGTTRAAPESSTSSAPTTPTTTAVIPGMPPVLDPANIYSAITPQGLRAEIQGQPRRVFVPNTLDNTVSVINPDTRQVIGSFRTSKEPQHVVVSYDLKTLWVLDNQGNDAIPVDAVTGVPGNPVPVEDPYNLYFTPDGKHAIVVAEMFRRLDFYTPDLLTRQFSVDVPGCDGVNHGDWSADGRYALFTCEFNGRIVKIDMEKHAVAGYLDLGADLMPQDLRAGPDGRTFYVAEMMSGGVHIIDGDRFAVRTFVPTGIGAHGITVSRDARRLFVANRGTTALPGRAPKGGEGSVSVFNLATNTVERTIPVPNGGSPDMGNLNVTGTELWLGGRFDDEVYIFDVTPGAEAFSARIPVGVQPHGLAYVPQPGRYSLGHTGNTR